MAMKWLSLHGEGHPNTTVMWSNGTHVAPHQVHEILHLAKRWGWADAAIELTLWGARAVTVTNAGLIAGFAAVVVVGLIGYAGYALAHAINPGTTVESGNNQKRNQLANGMEKRNNFEPNVFYSQLVGNQADTGQWPSTADMQNAVHSSLQDMADHDCEFR